MEEEDPKAENIIGMLWDGIESTKCDGNIYGYSSLLHILTTATTILQSDDTFMQKITNFFEANYEHVDYNIQYRFRSKSIAFFFYKEVILAFAMVVIFQYINY